MCDKCIYQKYIDKIEKMIATGNYNNVIDFLSGLKAQLEEKKHITEKQADAVNRIWTLGQPKQATTTGARYHRGHARVLR